MATTFAPGTVLTYTTLTRPNRWCREGTAIVVKSGRAIDTYWGSTASTDSHVLTGEELATAEVLFLLKDYDELDIPRRESPATWKRYAPADRRRTTSQHGLQARWFIRKGAEPDLATQIANAQQNVADAEVALRSAERQLDSDRLALAELQKMGSGDE